MMKMNASLWCKCCRPCTGMEWVADPLLQGTPKTMVITKKHELLEVQPRQQAKLHQPISTTGETPPTILDDRHAKDVLAGEFRSRRVDEAADG